MREKQISKREFISSQPSFNRKNKTNPKTNCRSEVNKSYNKLLRKKPTRIKEASKVSNQEMEEELPPAILKTCNNLEAVCIKIGKLEKEKQKLIQIILNDIPQRKRKLRYR